MSVAWRQGLVQSALPSQASRYYCPAVSIQYFKKALPNQTIYFSDGSGFRGFEVVNHEIGILATEDARVIRELEACIAGHRGGCEKITAEEFLSLQSQKKSSLKPQWREEWQPRKHPAKGPDKLAVGVAAAVEPPAVARPAAAPADGSAFRPKKSRT